MTIRKTTTALCALLLAAPAWAQGQAGISGGAPDEARQVRQGERGQLPPAAVQALAALSRTAVSAQQFGNLAGTKQAPAAVRELGDRMVEVNSEINDALDQVAARHGVALPQQMPEQQRQFFETLAETNRDEFARGLTAWVSENYPRSIRALQQVADVPGFEAVAARAIPQLREQLRVSQQVAEAYMQGGQMQATVPGERTQTNQ